VNPIESSSLPLFECFPRQLLAKQVDGMVVVVVDLDQTNSLMKIDFRNGSKATFEEGPVLAQSGRSRRTDVC
jgi:hypothetical protein